MQFSLPFAADPKLPRIRDCLIAIQGPQRDAWRLDPTSQFVNAMISSCTWDSISSAAFARLCVAFPSWKRLSESDPNTIAPIIAPVTRAAEKARDLVRAAHIIRATHGDFDLVFLADWPVDAAFSWLDRIRGVGPKITAVTLNFSTLRHRALAVDRHMLRSSKCLGLLPPTADFARGFRMLMRLIPDHWDADDLYELHWLMKTHSQTTCSQPQIIDRCPLSSFCAKTALLHGNEYGTIL